MPVLCSQERKMSHLDVFNIFTVHHGPFQLLSVSPAFLLPHVHLALAWSPLFSGFINQPNITATHILGPSVTVKFLTLQFLCPPFHHQYFFLDCMENLCLCLHSVANQFVSFVLSLGHAFVIYTEETVGKSCEICLFPQKADSPLPSSAFILAKEPFFFSFHSANFISICYLSLFFFAYPQEYISRICKDLPSMLPSLLTF